MFIRRAESKDIAEIKELIKGGFGRDDMERVLKRRYGDNYNLDYIIDTCPISIVVISSNGLVEGFLGLSFSPPTSLPPASEKDFDGNINTFSLHNNQWDKWLIDSYKISSTKIHNTLFVNFFCGGGDDAAHMLEALLRTVFEMDPSIQNIVYFLPDSLILFPPFSSTRPITKNDDKKLGHARLKKSKLSTYFFTACPSYSHCTLPYNLYVCQRKEFYPEFEVRRAKVEDCDDLIPILKRNKLLNENQGDHFMSNLLEQKNENFKAIVAEVDGEIVGFLCIDRDTDQSKLRETYNLELFDYLVKAPLCDPKAATRFVPTEEQLSIQNSFHVTLFCIDPKFAALSDKFLHYAFQIWPELDYCILTTLDTAPTSPLLIFFSPVPSLYENNEHMLFVSNRYGIKGVVDVVKALPAHLPAITKLTTSMENTDDLIASVRSTFADKGNQTFTTYVAIYDTQIIGTILLEYTDTQKSQAYLDQFDIEQFVDLKWAGIASNYSLVRYFIINPLFEIHSRYICREIMRQQILNCLLAPSNTSVKDFATKRVAIREFVPVKPRRMIEYPGNLRDGEPLPEEIKENLQIITTPLIYVPRMVVYTPIVVVGGSDTGLSLLENLIYNENIQFSNLVLISKDGCPKIDNNAPFVSKQCYNSLSIKQIAIDYFVKIIEDTIIQIHRHDKHVTLKSSTAAIPEKVRYEYLILTPGLQYNIMDLSPKLENVLGVHGFNRAEFKKIKPLLSMLAANDKLGKIVIYGRSLQAYMAVEYCLSLGIAGPRIHFYDPSIDQPLFEDKELTNITSKFLVDQKISYFEGHSFDSYEELDGRIFGLKFFDRMHKKVLIGSIGAFLYADEPKVDPYTFQSVNDANLVFDESIIIDNVFRTHDPYVFAAGSATKYSVSLNTEWKHRVCDSKEVGTRLAEFLMYLFDPNLPIDTKVLKIPVDNYRAAVKKFAKLPGGLFYFHYDIPKLSGYKHDAKRRDLILHEEGKEFCRVRVDPRGYIYSFTYLGARDIPLQNLTCLYGRHEKYFNRLVARFDEEVISDFISFFQETWALVMFHDRFPSFVSSLLEESIVKNDLKEIVDGLVNETKEMSIAQADEVYDKFDKTQARDEMNQSVFDYLMTTNVFKSYP